MDTPFYINNTVYCRLAPSGIHGVGVFAIRDIPKGQAITDYHGGGFYSYEVSKEEFNKIEPEIQTLIRQQTIFEGTIKFDSPNSHQILEVFMNHSKEPNSDGKITLREIKKGEELTKDYSEFMSKDELSAKILDI